MATAKRNIWLDNLKGFLIICVVAGHFLESGIDYSSDTCKALFLFIYSFHMPLFIFISGLMCEHAIATKERFYQRITTLFGLFLCLKLLIFPFQKLNNPNLSFSIVETDGVPWYLFALCIFYCCAYVLRACDKRKLLCVAFLLALLAGYDNGIGDVFVLSRCLVFFPWFVLGWMCNVSAMERMLHKKSMRILALFILCVFLILCRIRVDSFYIFRRFFTGRSSYDTLLSAESEVGILFRLAAYMITFVIGICVLSLVPSRHCLHLDVLGQNSLQIYFFHRPVLFYLEYVKTYTYLYHHYHGITNYLWLAIALLLVFLLAQPIFTVPFQKYNQWMAHKKP